MRYAWLYVLAALAVLAFASSAFASVVINEVLFNPLGVDTGLEKIELYNNSTDAAVLEGWQLYSDGGVYFTFPPSFSLSGKSLVTIHLGISGTANGANLYHDSVSSNMGNTAGSAALFSGEPRDKNTIQDFVQWGREGETWETAASDAGLWMKGDFVDIANLSEGSSISLKNDGVRDSALSWHILSLPTIGGLNSGDGTGENPSPVNVSQDSPPAEEVTVSSGVAPPPSLAAHAGADRMAFQGALLEFRGSADGINGEPLTSGRFSWNFGDGATREGKIVSHTYYFPGTYNISLNVSFGEYAGSDYVKVIIVSPDLFISEVKPGERGFVELYNDTAHRLDLGGFLLKDGSVVFAIERDTYINPKSVLVFSNIVTGLMATGRQLSLNDAHDFVIDSADFSLPLLLEESFERVSIRDKKFIKTKSPTPGAYIPAAGREVLAEEKQVSQGSELFAADGPVPQADNGDALENRAGISSDNKQEAVAVSSAQESISSFWFLAASFAIGIFAAFAFTFFRRI